MLDGHSSDNEGNAFGDGASYNDDLERLASILDYFSVSWSPIEGPSALRFGVYLDDQHLQMRTFTTRDADELRVRAVQKKFNQPTDSPLLAFLARTTSFLLIHGQETRAEYEARYCHHCSRVSFCPKETDKCELCRSFRTSPIGDQFQARWKGEMETPFVPPKSPEELILDKLNERAFRKIEEFRKTRGPDEKDLSVQESPEEKSNIGPSRMGPNEKFVLAPGTNVHLSGNEERATQVRALCSKLAKPAVVLPCPDLSWLDDFVLRRPNFRAFAERVARILNLASFRTDKLPRFPNFLFVGDTGTGKTSGVSELAEYLAPECSHEISMGQGTVNSRLVGISPHFKNSGWGQIVTALSRGPDNRAVYNPVIILDEIDKVSNTMSYSPIDALLSVLDRRSSSHFTDEYLEVPLDASGVRYLATANSIQKLPEALLNRFEVVPIRNYTPEEVEDTVVPSIYAHWLKDFPLGTLPAELSFEMCQTVAELARYSPRSVEAVLTELAGNFHGELCPWPIGSHQSFTTETKEGPMTDC